MKHLLISISIGLLVILGILTFVNMGVYHIWIWEPYQFKEVVTDSGRIIVHGDLEIRYIEDKHSSGADFSRWILYDKGVQTKAETYYGNHNNKYELVRHVLGEYRERY